MTLPRRYLSNCNDVEGHALFVDYLCLPQSSRKDEHDAEVGKRTAEEACSRNLSYSNQYGGSIQSAAKAIDEVEK